jgi:hypothetical protein
VFTQTLPLALAAEISDSETVFAAVDLAFFTVSVEEFVLSVFSTGWSVVLAVLVSEVVALLVASLADFFAFLVAAFVVSSVWKARKGITTTRPITAIPMEAILLIILNVIIPP